MKRSIILPGLVTVFVSARTKAAGGGMRKRAAFYTAGAALAVMAIATVVTDSGTGGSGATTVADAGTSISQTPGNAPSVAFAKPEVTPTSFAGQDWPGMGSFGEHWAIPGAGVGQGEHP